MAFDDGVKTVSGSIAHTDDAATKVPFVSVKCGIEPTLTGKSEVVCAQTGENLFDISTATGGQINGTNGNFYANANWNASDYIHIKGGVDVSLSWDTDSSNYYQVNYAFYDETKTYISGENITYANIYTRSFSVPSNAYYARFSWSISVGGTPAPRNNVRINYGASDLGYSDYVAPTTHTVNLGRTIYGGTADVVNGTGTDGSILIDLSELTWNVDGGTRFRARLADYTTGGGWAGNWQNTLSNAFTCVNPATAFTDRADYTFANIPQNYYNFDVKAPVGAFADANAFKQWLADIDGNNTHAVVVIDRLTAQTFTFTPITPTPETVGKVNNVYCDTGDTELTYHDNAHGFSEVTVNKTGKNLLNAPLKQGQYGSNGGYTGASNRICIRKENKFTLPKGQYTLSTSGLDSCTVLFFTADGSSVADNQYATSWHNLPFTFTVSNSDYVVVFTVRKSDNSNILPSDFNSQIELGSQASSYEPYEAISKTAYLHKVIYGGQADVVRGTFEPRNLAEFSNEANANRSSYEYATESPELIEWTKTGDGGKFYARFVLHIPKPGKYTISCSADSTLKVKYIYSDELWGTAVFPNVSANPFVADFSESGDYVLGFYAGSSATSGTLKEVMCEKGETKTDYAPYSPFFTFPPISMETDDGENTLFANEGDSAITYRKAVD